MAFDYDVVIVGSGVAGALVAWTLGRKQDGRRILVLEAGADSLAPTARAHFVDQFVKAPNRNYRASFADADADRYAPSSDGTGDRFAMNRYLVEPDPDLLKSGFERIVGGSTLAWRGNTPRWIPADFTLKTAYGVGVDWPFGYGEVEPFYCDAEDALGVAGDHAEWDGLMGARRSRPFPMGPIAPSFGDNQVRAAIGTGLEIDEIPISIVATPQARISNPEGYDGRSACQGNSNCIPVCPSGAKYDATVHLRKAVAYGVELRHSSVVTKLIAAGPANEVHAVVFKDWSQDPSREQTVTCDTVVLAANAIETPKLWLLSGLRNGSDQVGRNLMDHIQNEVGARFTFPLYPFRGPQSTLSIESFRDGPFRSQLGAFRMTIGNDGWGRKEAPRVSSTSCCGIPPKDDRAVRHRTERRRRGQGCQDGSYQLLDRAASRSRQSSEPLRRTRRPRCGASEDQLPDQRLQQDGARLRLQRGPTNLRAPRAGRTRG
jgi:choline dehydrogenase-like flavoprotein